MLDGKTSDDVNCDGYDRKRNAENQHLLISEKRIDYEPDLTHYVRKIAGYVRSVLGNHMKGKVDDDSAYNGKRGCGSPDESHHNGDHIGNVEHKEHGCDDHAE